MENRFLNAWWTPKGLNRKLITGKKYQTFGAAQDIWQTLLPDVKKSQQFIKEGIPFHAVIEGKHNLAPDPNCVEKYLEEGMNIILLQPHEYMPRLMHLMRELRLNLFDPFCNESSYLFMNEGKGKPGMHAHHDGDVHSIWIQIAGKRTVDIGPQIESFQPLESPLYEQEKFTTIELEPGSLLYLAPRVLHKVVCYEPSYALSLTWEPLSFYEIMAEFCEFAETGELRETWFDEASFHKKWTQTWKDERFSEYQEFYFSKSDRLDTVSGKPWPKPKKGEIPLLIYPQDLEGLSGWEMDLEGV